MYFTDAEQRGAKGEAPAAGNTSAKQLADQQLSGATRGKDDGGLIYRGWLLWYLHVIFLFLPPSLPFFRKCSENVSRLRPACEKVRYRGTVEGTLTLPQRPGKFAQNRIFAAVLSCSGFREHPVHLTFVVSTIIVVF